MQFFCVLTIGSDSGKLRMNKTDVRESLPILTGPGERPFTGGRFEGEGVTSCSSA